SYPLGSSVRTRSIRAGFSEADDGDVTVAPTEAGACPHAATPSDSAASKANSRTPVDTTKTAWKTPATPRVRPAMDNYQANRRPETVMRTSWGVTATVAAAGVPMAPGTGIRKRVVRHVMSRPGINVRWCEFHQSDRGTGGGCRS